MGLTTLKMPQLGESVTEGTVDRWLKQEGELVRRDEPIVEIVTDKVNAEVPSPVEGRLVRIKVASGQTVPIGTALAELEVEGVAVAPETSPEAPAARPAPAPPAHLEGRISPGLRKLLEDNGLELSQIAGTGPGGRVRREDVLAHLSEQKGPATATPAPAERRDELVRVSAVRRQIAEHMVRSVSTSPHAWSLREVDVSRMLAYRESEKEAFRARHGFALSYVP